MMCGVLEFPVLDPCSVSCFFGLCHSSQGDCLQPLCTAVPYPSSLERPSGHSGGLQRPPGDPRTRQQQLYQACGLLVPPLTRPFALRVGLGGNAAGRDPCPVAGVQLPSRQLSWGCCTLRPAACHVAAGADPGLSLRTGVHSCTARLPLRGGWRQTWLYVGTMSATCLRSSCTLHTAAPLVCS